MSSWAFFFSFLKGEQACDFVVSMGWFGSFLGVCWVVGSLREGGKGKGKIGVGDCWEGGFIKRSLCRISGGEI